MNPLGLIVGSALIGHEPGGADGVVPVQRHGGDRYHPPHLIDHAANLRALTDAGCDRVLAIASVGSLRPELGVGALLCPDDFIALHLGGSGFDDERGHRVSGFDTPWRRRVIEAWKRSGSERLADGGVYWEAIGPRFETLAEVRLIAAHADVVGMTVASECVVATEIGIPYAAVCIVDNLANGVAGEGLSTAAYEAGREANRDLLSRRLPALIEALEGVSA
jgi:5'-methylthioadenosine phosphorylase